MDPVTTAILAAASAGAASGLTTVGKDAVTDTYNGFKELIKKKFGKKSDLADAVDKLEARPDSEPRKGAIQEEVEIAKAHEDAELVEAADRLLEMLKAHPDGEKHVQQIAQGSYIAQAEGGSTAIVNQR